jgi:hypothetical protein
MFDTFMGLPVHALVMHAVVVLVPLSALGVVAIAVVPRWRERFGVLVVLLSTAGLAFVPVATRSGAALKDRINAGGVTAEQIDRHQQMGNLVLWPTLAMWVLAIALVLMSRGGRRRGAGVTLVAVLAVLGAGTAAVLVTLTGHLGSTAVWSCTIGSEACK